MEIFIKECIHGSEGIRQLPVNCCTMYIPNDDTKNNPSVDYIQWLKLLDTKLNEPINQNQ